MVNQADAAEWMVDKQLRRRGIQDPGVLAAMAQIPRHLFVPGVSTDEAYGDHALPIARGQTISQPYMVARMTELLSVRHPMRVLEIGTGSGYQTAVLASLGVEVVSIEHFEDLAERARAALDEVVPGTPIRVIVGDGTLGYVPAAPYDRILVTAGAPLVPPAYREQLTDPGRIVIPLGDRHNQILALIEREGDQFRRTADVACRFVPLVGKEGWDESPVDEV